MQVAELRILMRVFFLTIFFVDSIQLSNCDDVRSQYFHANGKGRIETWQPKRLARKRPRRPRRSPARSTKLDLQMKRKGRESVPFAFCAGLPVLRRALSHDAGTPRRRCGIALFGNVHERKSQLLPLVKAAQQRTHMPYAEPAEFQRHPGAGRFVGSSAEEDDLAIARDLAMTRLQVLR